MLVLPRNLRQQLNPFFFPFFLWPSFRQPSITLKYIGIKGDILVNELRVAGWPFFLEMCLWNIICGQSQRCTVKTKLSITKLSIPKLSITKLSMAMLAIAKLSITKLSNAKMSIRKLSIKSFRLLSCHCQSCQAQSCHSESCQCHCCQAQSCQS